MRTFGIFTVKILDARAQSLFILIPRGERVIFGRKFIPANLSGDLPRICSLSKAMHRRMRLKLLANFLSEFLIFMARISTFPARWIRTKSRDMLIFL